METTLHRELKEQFGPASGGRLEVNLGAFRIDAVARDGMLVEVQSGALGPLRFKLERLLQTFQVRVVKPVVVAKRIVRTTRRDGPSISARYSPKRTTILDVFDDFIGLASLFPHPFLTVDVLAVEVDEVRIARKKLPGYEVVDRRLRSIVSSISLNHSADLWKLVPITLDGAFTTRQLAVALARPLPFAQRVAYCLRLSGAVEIVGKVGNHRLYHRAETHSESSSTRLLAV